MTDEFDAEQEIQALQARLDATNRRLDNVIELLIGDSAELFQPRFVDTAPVYDQLATAQTEIEDLRREIASLTETDDLRADGWGDER